MKGYMSFDIPIHILEIQSSLDALRYNLGNLQYSNSYEKLKPEVYSVRTKGGTSTPVTLFNQVLSISNIASICSKMNLPVLDLDTLPVNLGKPVVLHFEVRIEDDVPLCVGVDSFRKGDACISYILLKTSGKEFVRTKNSLLSQLFAFKGAKLFMHADINKFVLSPISRGVSGCVGQMSITRDEFLSSVHNRYYSALGNTFLNLFDSLGDYLSVFAGNVHLLAMEGQPLPTEIINTDNLIKGILDLVPTLLPNGDFPLGTHPQFEKMFLKEIPHSNDDLIQVFADKNKLLALRPRDIKLVYNAFKEFDTNVRYRLSRFFRYFGDTQFDRLIPKTLLFRKDQNPMTFSSIIRSMIPQVDDHILIDTFSIVQNCKSTLLKDLGRFNSKNAEIRFIKHRQLYLAKVGEEEEIIDFDRILSTASQTVKPKMKSKNKLDSMQSDDKLSPSEIKRLSQIPDYYREVLLSQNRPSTRSSVQSPLIQRDGDDEDDAQQHQEEEDMQGEDSIAVQESTVSSTVSTTSITTNVIVNESPNVDSTIVTASSTTSPYLEDSPSSSLGTIATSTSHASSPVSTASTSTAVVSTTSSTTIRSTASTTVSTLRTTSGTTTRATTSSSAAPVPRRVSSTTPRVNQRANRSSQSSLVIRDESEDEDDEDTNVPDGFIQQKVQNGYKKPAKLRVIRSDYSKYRSKRSGWLTSLFGIATSDDIVGLFKSEVNLHEREEQVEEHIRNITASNNNLISSIQNVSDDIDRLAKADSDIFKSLESLMEQESTSMETLKKVAVTLDRLSVVSSEYHSLTTQTTLLLHSLEKAHSLVQNAINNIIDVARLPLEILDNVLSNHIMVSLQSASVEFTYTEQGYNVRYKIPRLSEPFKMYSIRSIPVFNNKLWLSLNLKDIYVSNSVSDTLEISEVDKKCYNTHTYYICHPEEVTIRHSEKNCELELIENYWSNPTNFSTCRLDNIITNPSPQQYIMTPEGLAISSAVTDKLSYICDSADRDKISDIPIGLKIFKYKNGCIYESSFLTIYNSLKSNILTSTFSEGVDREVEVISALTEVQSNLDDFMSANGFNISYDKIIASVQTEEKQFSVSVAKFKNDVKNFKDLKSLSFWNPTHFTLEEPASQSNALSAVFWIVLILIIIIGIGCCHSCCPCLCPAICAGLKAVFIGMGKVCTYCYNRTRTNQRNEIFNEDPEIQMSYRRGDIGDPQATAMLGARRRLPPVPSAPGPPSLRMSMYPDLELFYSTNKPEINWQITAGEYKERTIVAYVPNGQGAKMKVYYDPLLQKVTDRNGIDLKFIPKPSKTIINLFKEQVSRSPLPLCFRDENKVIGLQSHPEIKFDEVRQCWYHQETSRIISGLPPPPVDNIVYESM